MIKDLEKYIERSPYSEEDKRYYTACLQEIDYRTIQFVVDLLAEAWLDGWQQGKDSGYEEGWSAGHRESSDNY